MENFSLSHSLALNFVFSHLKGKKRGAGGEDGVPDQLTDESSLHDGSDGMRTLLSTLYNAAVSKVVAVSSPAPGPPPPPPNSSVDVRAQDKSPRSCS